LETLKPIQSQAPGSYAPFGRRPAARRLLSTLGLIRVTGLLLVTAVAEIVGCHLSWAAATAAWPSSFETPARPASQGKAVGRAGLLRWQRRGLQPAQGCDPPPRGPLLNAG
jgi:hypothetical protein